MPEDIPVSLANLARGGAIERFDLALEEVLDNILDPNTGEAARTITLKVRIKPNPERNRADLFLSCKAGLAEPKAVGTIIFIGHNGKKPVATEYNPNQMNLGIEQSEARPSNVQTLREVK